MPHGGFLDLHKQHSDAAVNAQKPDPFAQIVTGHLEAPPDHRVSTPVENLRTTRRYSGSQITSLVQSSAPPDLTLDYGRLTDIMLSENRLVDKEKIRFFISFSKSHPTEAHLMQRWLELHTSPRFVYRDDMRADWPSFVTKIPGSICVLLVSSSEMCGYATAPVS